MEKIKIKFPDGSVKEFDKGITGYQIAESISRRLADEALAIKINGRVRELNVPLTEYAEVQILTFDDEEGKEVYWHSSSHLMAHAIQSLHPEAKFGVGPAIENGFYYDFDINTQLSEDDLRKIEEKMITIAGENHPFERVELPKEKAIEFFSKKGDQYKLEILSELDDKNEVISIYNEGDFTDLCTGPHLPSTGKIKYVKLLSVSGSYWRGDEKNKQLQRIYGISFPKKKMLDEYLQKLEEAKRRDHRKLGRELEIFLITNNVGPGLPIWLPKGTILRETLENFLKEEQRKRGYLPVITPHIGNINLYKTSGHYPYYKDSQFPPIKFEEGNEEYLLKPMNCPHHFQIYASKSRSYRDLPIRYAEFGTVYRYEQSGELNGLTRVRCFSVDDSHIFVRQDQLKDEVCNVIELIQVVFNQMGFKEFTTQLSFRDDNVEKYGGDLSLWDKAQQEIKEAADMMGLNYIIEEGEAAFYGPKIDFMVKDALGRKWQLGTVQIDYVMPERFNLEYIGSDGQKHRPVVIHRAPFGSLERFIGVLIEHYAGEFPLWLAPVQVAVLPISQNYFDYATEVYNAFKQNGIRAELDDRNEKIGYKIRDWETKKVKYMVIVGEKEKENKTVSVRQHKEGDKGSLGISEFIDKIAAEIKNKS
ncbi:Threonyl-tRNA synthetase [Ignavibacterium album JCM 16511]|uniref:Threonine--tRNA ligase n=1 Tax=Ignavibacterium album (strain DSM 19864 / JCM 16511 / NBRC 101810 / Mat9-16) TaxID=945713 RepID=I0AJI8_IGNAJ|nr:threonine--tRNA ligase [Ignavibacterium album]AFH49145.1 Threonyl-tRNA synthetase [Ignavibacterium album JCM 16511]